MVTGADAAAVDGTTVRGATDTGGNQVHPLAAATHDDALALGQVQVQVQVGAKSTRSPWSPSPGRHGDDGLSGVVCAPPGARGAGVAGFGARQLGNAGLVAAVGKEMGVPARAWVVATAGVAESLALPHEGVGADHDSVGLFQQRASWGPVAARMDPRGAGYRGFWTGIRRQRLFVHLTALLGHPADRSTRPKPSVPRNDHEQ